MKRCANDECNRLHNRTGKFCVRCVQWLRAPRKRNDGRVLKAPGQVIRDLLPEHIEAVRQGTQERRTKGEAVRLTGQGDR